MESTWQTKNSDLYFFMNFHNLHELRMDFILHDGSFVSGIVSDYTIDPSHNCFLSLEDATVGNNFFPFFNIVGLKVSRWRISKQQCLEPILVAKSNELKAHQATDVADMSPIEDEMRLVIDASFSLLFRESNDFYSHIGLSKSDEEVFSGHFQLLFSNDFHLIRFQSDKISKKYIIKYLSKCKEIGDSLKSEKLIGFGIFPLTDVIQDPTNHIIENSSKITQKSSEKLLTQEYYINQALYLCFSTSHSNFVFYLSNEVDPEEDKINDKVIEILRDILESSNVCKITSGIQIYSRILNSRFNISLENVCDLQILDKHIKKNNSVNESELKINSVEDGEMKSVQDLVGHYLHLSTPSIDYNLTDWNQFSISVRNIIRMGIIFLRELSTQMNYQMMHDMFTYSNRALDSFRSATKEELEFIILSKPIDDIYENVMEPHFFELEGTINLNELKFYFPLNYFQPNRFVVPTEVSQSLSDI